MNPPLLPLGRPGLAGLCLLLTLLTAPGLTRAQQAPGTEITEQITTRETHVDAAVETAAVCPTSYTLGNRNRLRFRVTTTFTEPKPYTSVITVSPETIAIESTAANRGATWTVAGGTATLQNGTIVAGDTLILEVVLLPINPGTGTRSIMTTTNGIPSTNERCTFPVFGPDLQVTKVASTDAPSVGSVFAYGFNALNPGPVAVPNAIFTDGLPANLSYLSSPTGCTHENGTVTCTSETLEPGVFTQHVITVEALAEGTVSNTVSLTGGFPEADDSNNTSTLILEVAPAQLAFEKTASADRVAVGDTLTYTLTLDVLAGSGTDFEIEDRLPEKVAFLDVIAPDGVTCVYVFLEHMVRCGEAGERTPASGPLMVQIITRALTSGACPNKAVAFDSSADGLILVAEAQTMTVIDAEPRHLFVSALAFEDPDVSPFGTNIVVAPADLQGLADGTTLAVDPFAFERIYDHGTLVDLTATLAQNGLSFGFWASALFLPFPTAPFAPHNILRLSMTQDQSVFAIYTPQTDTDLSVALADVPGSANMGEPVTGTLVVDNSTGAASAYGVDLTLRIGGGLTFNSLTFTEGPCTTPSTGQTGPTEAGCTCTTVMPDEDGDQNLRCMVSWLAQGQAQRATFSLTATEAGTGSLSATASHAGTDPEAGNDQATRSLEVGTRTADADLGVTVRSFPTGTNPETNPGVPTVALGESVSFLMEVTHHDGVPVEDVVIEGVVLGASASVEVDSPFFRSTDPAAFCTLHGNTPPQALRRFTCQVARLEPGQSQAFTYTARQPRRGIPPPSPDRIDALLTVATLIAPTDRTGSEEPDQGSESVGLLGVAASTTAQFFLLDTLCRSFEGAAGPGGKHGTPEGPCVLKTDTNGDGVIDDQDEPVWVYEGDVPEATPVLGPNAGIRPGRNRIQLLDRGGTVLLDEEEDLGVGENTVVIGGGDMMVLRHEDVVIPEGRKRVTFWYAGDRSFSPELTLEVTSSTGRFIERITRFLPGDIESVGIPFGEFNGTPNVRISGPDVEEEYELIPLADCVWVIRVFDDAAAPKSARLALEATVFDPFGNGVAPLIVTGTEAAAETPTAYLLHANYPNPFSRSTQITYDLPQAGFVKLTLYNLYGQRVQTLVAQAQRAGRYSTLWDGTNQQGVPVAGGVYLYRLETDSFTQSRKMMRIR